MRHVELEDTFYFKFTTRIFATGIPGTLGGTPVISAYEDANLTQITAGITLTADYDSVTGLNHVAVVATAANGFEAGKYYSFVITTGTVSSVSVVGEQVHECVIGPVPANVIEIDDDATAADNLEAMYDGTGYTADTAPATQSQLSGIANVGAAVNKPAASYTLTTGTQSSGTITSTNALDGTRHEHTDVAGAMDLYYEFLIGGGVPTSVTATGYLSGNNDSLEVYGYDWVAAGWVQIGTMVGKASTENEVDAFELFVDMVGTGSDEGKVRVRFTDGAFTLTSATLAIDQIFCSFAQATEGYEDGAVWLDTNASNTNTEVGIDGVSRNPVSTIGAVNTLLASTNLRNVHVAPGSSVTFAASQDNQAFLGHDWTLALGSQSISNTYIEGADITGVATGANPPHFVECRFDDATLPSAVLRRCRLAGTTTGITLGTSAGNYVFEQCFSGVAGNTPPLLTFGASTQTVSFRHYSGGIQVESMIAGQTMTLEGHGQFIEGTCTGGAATIRGMFTTSGVTNVTLTDDARIDVAQIFLQAVSALTTYNLDHLMGAAADGTHVVNDSVIAQLVSATATADWDDFDNTTDSLQAVSDRLPTALVSGRMSADMVAISGDTAAADNLEASAETIVQAAAEAGTLSTTQMTTSLTEATADHYVGRVIVWRTGDLTNQATDITAYAAAGGLLTFTAVTEPPTAGDTFVIV